MNGSDIDREYEEKRLQHVLEETARQLAQRKAEADKYKSAFIQLRTSLHEDGPKAVTGFEDLVEVTRSMADLKAAANLHRFSQSRQEQLARLLRSPYFARVDFRESGREQAQAIYIGISSLMEEQTGHHLVFDWRAPVSGIYYDFELGSASYEAPLGTVSGDMLLKRHFRIRDGRLLFMFDNSLTVYDEMLQEALGSATGERMQSIVNTIQREQNRIIRGENKGALIVQGAAGSGKTIIALHRAAYLLYKHRGTMAAKNILMLSPGKLFVDYTSPVLPELGEEPITQTSFGSLARENLTGVAGESPVKIERQSDQLEFLFDRVGTKAWQTRSEGLRLKSSPVFRDLVLKYGDYITENALGLGEIAFRGQVVMTQKESNNLLAAEYTYLPLEKRVDKVKRRANWLLDKVEEQRAAEILKDLASSPESAYLFAKEMKRMSRQKAREEVAAVRRRVDNWKPVSAHRAFARLFEVEGLLEDLGQDAMAPFRSGLAEIKRDTAARLRKGIVAYEDLAPLLLLSGLLDGFPRQDNIKHVIVDEMQDLSPVQHEVLRRLFPNASFTLLGDVNQMMQPEGQAVTYDEIIGRTAPIYEEVGSVLPVRLTESYRSTKQIAVFAKALLPEGEAVLPVERPGELPRVRSLRTRPSLANAIAQDVLSLKKEGFGSIAVVCKTQRECWSAFNDLMQVEEMRDLKPHLIGAEETRFKRGLLVIPSYLTKGLEFECVIVYNAGKDRYGSEGDRRILYTVCTRALHRLHIYCLGKPSPFITDIDSELYCRPGYGNRS